MENNKAKLNPSYDTTLSPESRIADFLGKYFIGHNGSIAPNRECKKEIIDYLSKHIFPNIMNQQEKIELPRDKMKKIIIAFDVDGTLIRSGGNHPDIANQRIVELLKILSSFKNVKIVVWSGGGKDYAARWGLLVGVDNYVWKYASKMDYKEINADIAIDDIHATTIGKINLIVKKNK